MSRPLEDFLPNTIRTWIKESFHNSLVKDPVSTLKYLPSHPGSNSYAVRKSATGPSDDLPIPPQPMWLGYSSTNDEYIEGGQRSTQAMLDAVQATDYELCASHRVLDFGCAAGRMIRHLRSWTDSCEVWGCDISGDSMLWAKTHLTPPFRFFTNTTIPHLPFEDGYFNLIYAASVFTHIEDTAEAWLLELRRVLSRQGRLFITIQDNHSMELLQKKDSPHRLTQLMTPYKKFREWDDQHLQLVVGRDRRSAVFYDMDYFRNHVATMFEIVNRVPECHDFQTGVVLAHPDAATVHSETE